MSIVKYRVVWIDLDVFGKIKLKCERRGQGIIAEYDNIEDARDYLHKYCRCTITPLTRAWRTCIKYQIERHIISGIDEDGQEIMTCEFIELAKWWDE